MRKSILRRLIPQGLGDKIDYAVKVRRDAIKVIRSKIDMIPEKKNHIHYLRSHFFMPQFRLTHVVFADSFVEKYLNMPLSIILPIFRTGA